VPRFPSKSGLIHKHIVKHSASVPVYVRTNTQPYREPYRETYWVLRRDLRGRYFLFGALLPKLPKQTYPSKSGLIHKHIVKRKNAITRSQRLVTPLLLSNADICSHHARLSTPLISKRFLSRPTPPLLFLFLSFSRVSPGPIFQFLPCIRPCPD
jgi:hypothetical protein